MRIVSVFTFRDIQYETCPTQNHWDFGCSPRHIPRLIFLTHPTYFYVWQSCPVNYNVVPHFQVSLLCVNYSLFPLPDLVPFVFLLSMDSRFTPLNRSPSLESEETELKKETPKCKILTGFLNSHKSDRHHTGMGVPCITKFRIFYQ